MEDKIPAASPTAEQLVAAYVKIRDAKREIERKRDEEIAALDSQLSVLEAELLSICKEQGMDGLKTKAGTASRRVRTRYWTNDWESFYNFVKENDAFPLLEKRLHQGNMKQFLEENPTLLPAGLNTDSQYAIVVTRSKSND